MTDIKHLTFDTLIDYFPNSGIQNNMRVYLKFNNRLNSITFAKNTVNGNVVDIFLDGDKVDVVDIVKQSSCIGIFSNDLYIYVSYFSQRVKIVLHVPHFYELSNMLSLTVQFDTKFYEYRCYRNLNVVVLSNQVYYDYAHKRCKRCNDSFVVTDKCCIDEKIDYYHYNCYKYLPI